MSDDTSGRRRHWRDLSTRQRFGIVATGAVEAVLTTAAAVDLSRRPRAQVRGPKALWWLAIFVQPVGPPAYLLLGRRTAALRRPWCRD